MKTKETLTDMISRRLTTEFRGLYTQVARATGMPFSNISRMARKQNSPSLCTAEVVIDFLEAYDASWKGKKPLTATPDAFLDKCIAKRGLPTKKASALGSKRK